MNMVHSTVGPAGLEIWADAQMGRSTGAPFGITISHSPPQVRNQSRRKMPEAKSSPGAYSALGGERLRVIIHNDLAEAQPFGARFAVAYGGDVRRSVPTLRFQHSGSAPPAFSPDVQRVQRRNLNPNLNQFLRWRKEGGRAKDHNRRRRRLKQRLRGTAG
ncbi:hypothetical protein SKAU_G00319450 [Synaphobranchus kaupii]|uniref:Uncharacterized protein n=1 Tax=Synaphobranchus kaupii TaxID=118154 RepID=A0A9Q1IJE4_SYNKA|nr:hypothetical protein SKAU_G00319450 [Synaphobranchus kaupii]